jgi:CRP/FNR family transcriptional regulator
MLTINSMKKKSIPLQSFLITLDIFKVLPSEELKQLENHSVQKEFLKGYPILWEGDSADYVWFVKEGHVKSVVHMPNGKIFTTCWLQSKSMFGTCCDLKGNRYGCHAIAASHVTVVGFPRQEFLNLMERFPKMTQAIVGLLSKKLKVSKERLALDQEKVERKILRLLIELSDEFGTTIPLTRREISEILGVTVETCIRVFSKLEKQELLTSSRGKIHIIDLSKLNGFLTTV